MRNATEKAERGDLTGAGMLDNLEVKMVMVNISRCQFPSGGLLYKETNTGEGSA